VPVVSYLPTEILDYIETHQPEDAVYGVSQRELARALGYHSCSMSRPLATLVERGLLKVRRAQVRGGARKQLVYTVTDPGRAQLQRKERDLPLLVSTWPQPPAFFVGRREELKELKSLGTKGGRILHLQGESGIGKTSLVVRAMRGWRAQRTAFWFTVRPASSARHFTTALAHALGPGSSGPLAYYAQLPREPSGREVASLARRVLEARAFVGVIDDAHAASPDLKAFLSEFAVAMVGSDSRDLLLFLSQQESFLPEPEKTVYTLRLGGIDRAAAHLITDRKGGLGPRFEAIYTATHGSPLLLQLAMAVPGEGAVPASGLADAAVGRLTADEVEALLPLSLANEPLPRAFLLDSNRIAAGRVQELVGHGIVQPASEGRVEILQAVRGALIARVGAAELRQAHRELARFYGRSHRIEAIRERFLHLVSGEAWREAGELLSRSESSLVASGYSEALRQALEQVMLSSPSETVRVMALRAEGHQLRVHGDYTEAVTRLRRAAAASRDPRVSVECLLGTVELHSRLRQTKEARQAVDEARRIGASSRRIQILLTYCEGRITELQGAYPKAREFFFEAFESARKSKQPDLALESLARWFPLASVTEQREGMTPLIDFWIREARLSGRIDMVFNLMSQRARNFVEMGQPELALSEMNKMRAEAESLGYLSQQVSVLSGLSALATAMSRWDEARRYTTEASELAERLGNDLVWGHTTAIACSAALRQGRLDEARALGEKAVQVLSKLAPTDSLGLAHGYLAEVLHAQGDFEAGKNHYQTSLSVFGSLGMSWWVERTRQELGARFEPVAVQ
jgi:tetratricopeptide (TPR) repeat protein/DNA-binding MarR family transcriptional regulator